MAGMGACFGSSTIKAAERIDCSTQSAALARDNGRARHVLIRLHGIHDVAFMSASSLASSSGDIVAHSAMIS